MLSDKYTGTLQPISKIEMLLYDILVSVEAKEEPKKLNKVCVHCGERHERAVDYANCSRKHKKEGNK